MRSPQTRVSAAIHPATRSSSRFLAIKNQRENIPFCEEMQRDLSGCSGEKEWHLICDRLSFLV